MADGDGTDTPGMVPVSDLMAQKAKVTGLEAELDSARSTSKAVEAERDSARSELRASQESLGKQNEELETLRGVSERLTASEKTVENFTAQVTVTTTAEANELGLTDESLKDKTLSEINLMIAAVKASKGISADGNNTSDGDSKGDGDRDADSKPTNTTVESPTDSTGTPVTNEARVRRFLGGVGPSGDGGSAMDDMAVARSMLEKAK